MKNIFKTIKTKYNELSHSKTTGARLTPITDAIDNLTQINTTRALKPRELTKLRTLTIASTGAKVGTSIATGVILGKSVFTGSLLAIGAYVISDIVVYSPMQTLTNRVLTSKSK